ncbi:MAG: M23 family metallopeptidase [Fibrobacter sp.]|nr:M23 family metallopeptidase [Fibrobacter sp.]
MKKIEVHVFSKDTSGSRNYRFPVWKLAVGIVACIFAILGFILFSPAEIIDRISDGNVVDVYKQNSFIKKQIKQIREKVDESILKAEEARLLRDSTVVLSGMGFSLENAGGDDELAPMAKDRKGVLEIERTMRKAVRLLEADSALAASIPVLHPIKNSPTVKNRFELIFDQFTQQNLPHRGIDFVAAEGDTVFAPGGGTVIEIRSHRGFGLTMKIEHTKRVRTFYAHLGAALVKTGQKVSRGDPIAVIAESGRESSVGLHYEVRIDGIPVDPEGFFITK